MISRAFETGGDILPAIDSADLLTGADAIAAGLRDHLGLYPGYWWETPGNGNPVFELMAVSRRTEQDAATLASCICGYILDFPGVVSISDLRAGFTGNGLSVSCIVHTEDGENAQIQFSAP